MPAITSLLAQLDELKIELSKSVDFTERYDDITESIKYIDFVKSRLENPDILADRKLRYGALRQTSQINKELTDSATWRKNPTVEPLLLKIMDHARQIIKDENL